MNVNKTCNKLNNKKNSKILVNIEVIVYVTYHLEGSFVILKWILVVVFYL